MKKFIFIFAALFAVLGANAQIATENSKFFDNWSVGVGAGATTPLDFNSVFPVNTGAKIIINKDFTPVVGLQAEGGVLFNDNNFGRWTSTMVKLTNVGLNGTINVNNLLFGYKGAPRVFEVSTNTGLGWLHYWNAGGANDLTAKTGVDFAFNIGKAKAISLVLSPAVYWNLTGNQGRKIQFNKHNAQLAVSATLVYHFKTSNGTRHFKTYDVGALIGENAMLRNELENTQKLATAAQAAAPVTNAVAEVKKVEKIVKEYVANPVYVFFAKNSSVLTDEAKAVLDKVEGVVEITASASIEGSKEYNQKLSEKRAAAVADYLTKRNIDVKSFNGIGAQNNESARVAVVKIITD